MNSGFSFDENLQFQNYQFGYNSQLEQLKQQFQTFQNDLNTANAYNLAGINAANQYNLANLNNQFLSSQASEKNITSLNVANVNAGAALSSAEASANAKIQSAQIGAQGLVEATALKTTQSAANVATQGAFGLASAGIGVASGLISGGLNYLYAKNLINQQAAAQRTNFDYMTNKAENAFTSQGLPSWLAFTGGAGAGMLPKTSQSLGGQNFFTSALPGNTSQLAWTGSQSQLALGVGSVPDVVS